MASKLNQNEILDRFFQGGAVTPLFGQGAVSAVFGCVGSVQRAYAIWQDGSALGAKDIDRMARVLELAAETGRPVVTFYNSVGA